MPGILTVGLVLALGVAVPAAEKEGVLWEKLRSRIEAVGRGLDGVLGVAVKDLKTGAAFEIRGNEVFPQASIKVAVLYELYRQARTSPRCAAGRRVCDELVPRQVRTRASGIG